MHHQNLPTLFRGNIGHLFLTTLSAGMLALSTCAAHDNSANSSNASNGAAANASGNNDRKETVYVYRPSAPASRAATAPSRAVPERSSKSDDSVGASAMRPSPPPKRPTPPPNWWKAHGSSQDQKHWAPNSNNPGFIFVPEAAPIIVAGSTEHAVRQPPVPVSKEAAIDIQRRLKEFGYYFGPIDGIIGPVTRAAIRAYQGSCGFPATGEIDARLIAAMGLSRPA